MQDAGNAVKRATEALVNEAQKVHSWSSSSYYEESSVTVDERMVGGMAQVRCHPAHSVLVSCVCCKNRPCLFSRLAIVWRVRGKTIRSVLCNIVCSNCAQCDAHTYEQTNSFLDWVLSHWAHFTVLRFIFVLRITVCCLHAHA